MMQSLFPDDYKVDLEIFEGPLDLLLYLIRKDELDICDIPIDRITDQYMEYLNLMKILNLDIAGEFVVMASTLSFIKSRMLLPPDERAGGDDSADDPEDDPRRELVRQLLAYKRFKDASETLSDMEDIRQNEFAARGITPAAGMSAEEGARDLSELSLPDLMTAFRGVLERARAEPTVQIAPIRWTLPDKMHLIMKSVSRGGVKFSELFDVRSPRCEIIITFLALLELLKRHRISVTQSGRFAEIIIGGVRPPKKIGEISNVG